MLVNSDVYLLHLSLSVNSLAVKPTGTGRTPKSGVQGRAKIEAGTVAALSRFHPHVRGDNTNSDRMPNTPFGSPPRAWGHLTCWERRAPARHGFTPTCVMKTFRYKTTFFQKDMGRHYGLPLHGIHHDDARILDAQGAPSLMGVSCCSPGSRYHPPLGAAHSGRPVTVHLHVRGDI